MNKFENSLYPAPPLPLCIRPPWFPVRGVCCLTGDSYSPGRDTSWMFMGLPVEGDIHSSQLEEGWGHLPPDIGLVRCGSDQLVDGNPFLSPIELLLSWFQGILWLRWEPSWPSLQISATVCALTPY